MTQGQRTALGGGVFGFHLVLDRVSCLSMNMPGCLTCGFQGFSTSYLTTGSSGIIDMYCCVQFYVGIRMP